MNLRIWDRKEKSWFKGQWVISFAGGFAIADENSNRYEANAGMGRNDKNGREIFEGDIVKVENDGGLFGQFVVKFGRAERSIVALYNSQVHFPVEINGFYFENAKGEPYFSITKNFKGCNDLELTEVIGNIFENPELL